MNLAHSHCSFFCEIEYHLHIRLSIDFTQNSLAVAITFKTDTLPVQRDQLFHSPNIKWLWTTLAKTNNEFLISGFGKESQNLCELFVVYLKYSILTDFVIPTTFDRTHSPRK